MKHHNHPQSYSPSVLLVILLLLPWNAVYAQSTRATRDLELVEPVRELPHESKRYALLIGVDKYDDSSISQLEGATNDANALGDALKQFAGFPEGQITKLTSDMSSKHQPTRREILRHLSNLKKIAPKDGLFLMAFSGHSIDRNGKVYLIPSDGLISDDIRLIEQTAISFEEIKDAIKEAGIQQVIFMLDGCRNDPAPGRSGDDNLMTESYKRAFNFDIRNREISAFITLYATEVGKRAYEYDEKKQGYFTYAIVEALRGKALSARNEITLGSLIKYVQENVPKWVWRDLARDQRPFVKSEGYLADELIIAVSDKRTPKIEPLREQDVKQTRHSPAPAKSHDPYQDFTFTTLRVNRNGIVVGRITGKTQSVTEQLGNGVVLEMIRISAGKYLMGSSEKEKDRDNEEGPQRAVTVDELLIGKFEVTREQWREVANWPMERLVLNPDPSKFKDDWKQPVERISWEEAVEFCERLSRRLNRKFRLLSEAEWEYAAKGGAKESLAFGTFGNGFDPDIINNGEKTKKAGSIGIANAFGLYDMLGNVWEWCQDRWHGDYDGAPENGNAWESGISRGRVIRGGAWGHHDSFCRVSYRTKFLPGHRHGSIGFRVACNIK